MQEQKDERYAQHTGQRGPKEAPLPAESGNQHAHKHKGKAFANVMGATEKAVECTADAQGEPARQRDNGRRGAHGLRCAVDGPADGKNNKQGRIGNATVKRAHAQNAHHKVHEHGNGKSRGHEALDVGAVCQEAAEEFANGISPIQAGADDTQLGGVQQARVNERLLHHAHGQSAHVVKGIAQRGRQEGLHPQAFVGFIHFVGGDLLGRWGRHLEKVRYSHASIVKTGNRTHGGSR